MNDSFFGSLEKLIEHRELQKLADVFRSISFKPFETYHLHQHARLEMSYVKRGSCMIESEGDSLYFKQDELMLITSNVNHSFEAGAQGCTLLQLEFLPDIFGILTNHKKDPESGELNLFLKEENGGVIKSVNNARIMQCIQKIITEINSKSNFHKHLVMLYYAELLILINRHLKEEQPNRKVSELLHEGISYIKLNYNKELSTLQVAEHLNISDRYLRRLFTQNLNSSPTAYINQVRINKAMELLRISDISIKEICFQCGFSSPQYFTKVFKQYTGAAPKEMRFPPSQNK